MNRLIVLSAALAANAAVATEAYCGDPVTIDEKGLTLDVAGDDLTLNLGGRAHFDFATFSDDVTPLSDDARLRRARVELGGRVLDDWRFRVDYEFGSFGRGFKNVWASYEGVDGLILRGGNFVAPFSMEDIESSNSTPAMERSLVQALAPSFLLGGAATLYDKHWSLSGGYFFNPISQDSTNNNDDGESLIARGAFVPLNNKDQTLHFAASVELRDLKDTASTRVRTYPEAPLAGARLVDTQVLSNVDNFRSFGVEAAYRLRNLLVRGQYIQRNNESPLLGDPSFDAAYAEASLVLNGKGRNYSEKSGAFGAVRPASKFGAVELVARVSMLDLNDGLVAGGEQTDYLAGVNWYLGRNIRIMGDYVRAEASPNRNGVDESADIYQARLQIAF